MPWPAPALERVLVALLVGVLIGLDRERAEARKARRQFAGVRTFPLIALAGALPALLLDRIGPALLVVSFLAVAAVTVVSYQRSSAGGDVGATTEVAAMATFLLGVLAGVGEVIIAGATGVAVAVLLVAKPRLEAFSQALSQTELEAVLELAVISVIVLPLVPNKGYGPWNALNPFEIWLVVVLVSGVGFAGFVAMRLLGAKRGIPLAGLVGSLVSSTAVTVSMASESRLGRGLAKVTAAAAILASSVMGIRVVLLTGAVDIGIVPRLVPVVAVMTVVGAAAAWWLLRDSGPAPAASAETKLSNPFSLMAAVAFGVGYALVLLLVRASEQYLGTRGLFVAAGVSGIGDVDAIAIACARLGPSVDGWRDPAAAVTIALVTNTFAKLGIALSMGGQRFRRYVAFALATMGIAGALAGVLIAQL
jgi:uncharacterized membrane protein (DUF4010 family)